MSPELLTYLDKNNIKYKENFNLKYSTYFKLGGLALLYITPTSEKELQVLLQYLNSENIDYKLVGGTSNVIFFDEGEYSIVVCTKFVSEIYVDENEITVSSGYELADLVRVALINKGKGFEGLEGIPGTVGGAVFMNAGAYGYEVSDKIISVKAIDSKGKVIVFGKDECLFNFRNSIFKEKNNYKILSVKFKLDKEGFDLKEVADKVEVFHIARHSYQEFSLPNLGSMYSLRKDMYKTVLTGSIKRNLVYAIAKIFFRNRFYSFFLRKKPTNKYMIKAVSMFENIDYPLSHKSLNILINNGGVSGIDIVNHIVVMNKVLGEDSIIENEIVTDSLIYIEPKIKQKLDELGYF